MARKSLFTFDRWDYLATRIVLGVVAVVVVGASVIAPLLQMWKGQPLAWQLETGVTDALVTDKLDARAGAELTWPGIVDVRIDDAGTGTWLATIAPGAVLALGTIVVVAALLRLLSSIESPSPFAPAAVRSLRVVGATLLIGSLLLTVASSFADQAVMDAAIDLTGDQVSFTLDLGMVVVFGAAGLLCAALAEAFNHGIGLADDVEGLV